jgi:hypothetical protein
MKNLAHVVTSALVAFAFSACGDDGGGGATGGTDTDTDPSTTDPSTTDPTTGVTDTETTDPTDDCSDDDPCRTDADCAGEQTCIACLCVGDAGCPGGRPQGTYGECLTPLNTVDISQCDGGPMPGCVVDNTTNPTGGSCFFGGCTDICDCPEGPEGFEDNVVCDALTSATTNDCFLSCMGGRTCPEGMFCVDSYFCAWGEATILDTYGDCINEPGQCDGEGGFCLQTQEGDVGVCTMACTTAADCPDAPDSGNAPVACVDVTGAAPNECLLLCNAGQTCPDGMACINDQICMWEEITEPPEGFNDCANFDEEQACVDGESCFVVEGEPNRAVCMASCTTADDCPAAPATGDAPVACADIDDAIDGNECHLDCSGDVDCPNGAECVDDTYCSYAEDTTAVYSFDFETQALPDNWVEHNEDGLTPDANLPLGGFDTAAWQVFQWGAGNYAAISTSWYNPAGTSDDWMATDALTIPANATLRWVAQSGDPDFPDGYEVRINLVGNDPEDFEDAPVFEIAAETAAGLIPRSVSLADFSGVDVYIAFRNVTNDGAVLAVDDVRVTAP